jgi:hypothetical protein
MIYDSEGKGLETIYKPYQVEALRFIMASRHPVNTKQVYDAVKARGCFTHHGGISRATIINFLAAQAEEGLLTVGDETGKGGHRALYSVNSCSRDEAALRHTIKTRLIESIEKQLGE